MAAEPRHFRITYNQVHNLIKRSANEIAEFKPDVILAIGKTLISNYIRALSYIDVVDGRWRVCTLSVYQLHQY